MVRHMFQSIPSAFGSKVRTERREVHDRHVGIDLASITSIDGKRARSAGRGPLLIAQGRVYAVISMKIPISMLRSPLPDAAEAGVPLPASLAAVLLPFEVLATRLPW